MAGKKNNKATGKPKALTMSSSSRISTAKDLRNDLRRADRTSH
jgi:hypothetical protein